MTKLLEQAMDRARDLPPEAQDEIARIVPAYAGEDRDVIQLTAQGEASFAAPCAQAANRQLASGDQVEAVRAKHGLLTCGSPRPRSPNSTTRSRLSRPDLQQAP